MVTFLFWTGLWRSLIKWSLIPKKTEETSLYREKQTMCQGRACDLESTGEHFMEGLLSGFLPPNFFPFLRLNLLRRVKREILLKWTFLFYFFSFNLILFHSIPFYFIPLYFFIFHFNSFYFIPFLFILFHPFHSITFHSISFYFIPFYFFLFHLNSFHSL